MNTKNNVSVLINDHNKTNMSSQKLARVLVLASYILLIMRRTFLYPSWENFQMYKLCTYIQNQLSKEEKCGLC